VAIRNSVPNFVPSVNGLHFVNSWPNEPIIDVNVPGLGAVPIGDASNGLCGGMVYTVIDVFRAGIPPIADTNNPPHGGPLFTYIVGRLFDSFDLPDGVLKYYDWMTTPDADVSLWVATRRGVAWHTIVEECPRIKDDVDSGALSPLGLVTVHTTDPTAIGHNHQVLAHAYELDDQHQLTLHLYDPNTDPSQADGVRLSLPLDHPTTASAIIHNVGIDRPIRGFFRTKYTFKDPSTIRPARPD